MTDLFPRSVDMHAHYFPPDYLAALRAAGKDVAIGEDPLGGPEGMEKRLAMMSDAGIEIQLLSGAPLFPTMLDPAAASAAAMSLNDSLINVARQHPGRFLAASSLPLPHVAESLAEIERLSSISENVAIAVPTSIFGSPLTALQHDPIFRALDSAATTLLLHPIGNATEFFDSSLDLSWLLGAVFEDTLAAADMILSGWLDRFPRLRIVVPHLGGALPFVLKRLDDQYLRRNPGAPRPSSQVSRLWFDTVNSDPAAFALALEAVGSDRLMLGTDFPYLPDEMFADATTYFRCCDLSTTTVHAVQRGNAEALLVRDDR